MDQKSKLQEVIEKRGHLCDFYPKFHCELNFIERYWGAAKYTYRNEPRPLTIAAMEQNVKASLDALPLLQIKR
jgi:transposase